MTSVRVGATLVVLLLALVGAPAFANDRTLRTADRAVEQPFRFPGTTPLPATQPFRFPGTTPLPGLPPARVSPQNAMPSAPAQQHTRSTIIIVQAPVYYEAPRPTGAWSYRWVPRYYEVPIWVSGYWAPDGWVDAHYESRWADYGNWEPYWVPAY